MKLTTDRLKEITRGHTTDCECDHCWELLTLEDRFDGAGEIYDHDHYAEQGEPCYYLSGSLPKGTRAKGLGILVQPDTGYMGKHLGQFERWAADNGCFSKGDQFDLSRYMRFLTGLGHRDSCMFATAPDVVGDPVATWERSQYVLPALRHMGYQAALVAQDGIEYQLAADPRMWEAFDVLFIGGSTEWKINGGADPYLSEEWVGMFREAHRRGKAVHMGRVNSWKRFQIASHGLGCSSVDGNYLKFNPKSTNPHSWAEKWNWPFFQMEEQQEEAAA